MTLAREPLSTFCKLSTAIMRSPFCLVSAHTEYPEQAELSGEVVMRKWQCVVCGFIYDEALGLPDEGIPPGTAWEDVPADWLCPDCGVGKLDFEMIEIA
jgi:rubredoxin